MADDTTQVMDAPEDSIPWSMQTVSPTGVQETITGSRPRPPIAPPAGMGMRSGMPVPDLGPIYNAAFQNLPVEQADKAIAAATQYIGQRGYMKDLEGGMPAAQAMAKWGPMLFHNKPTGMATVIQNSAPRPAPQITPQQQVQNALNQKRFELEQQKFQAAAKKPGRVATVTVPLDPENPDGAKITGPANDPDVQAAIKKHEDAFADTKAKQDKKAKESGKSIMERVKSVFGAGPTAIPMRAPTSPAPDSEVGQDERAPNPAAPAAAAPAKSPFKEGAVIRSKKDGKLYRVVNGEPVPIKE